MIGIGVHNAAQPRRFEIVVLAFAQVHDNCGTAGRLGAWFDAKLAFAVGDPAPTLALASLAAPHLNLFGNHKRRIKADAELADQAHILAGVARELVDKSGGAGARDRAEIFDELLSIHADAVIGNGQSASGLVGGEDDTVAGIAFGQRRLGQSSVAQSVAGVRGIRNELAEEDLFFAVERVRDNIEQAAYFRLEASGFLGHSHGCPVQFWWTRRMALVPPGSG